MKKLIFALIIVLLSANVISAKAAAFGPKEWTQFRMNPENNPVYHGKTKTEIDMVIKTNDEVRSTPVIVGDNVYIGNDKTGGIYSYNLKTEDFNWSTKAPNWIHSEIIYVDGQLFVGYGNRFFQEDGTRGTGESGLLSLDPKSGEVLWDYKTKGEVMPTPAFYKGTVYITTGDKHLYGINAKNGEEKWRLELGNVVSMSSPNIKNGVLYVGAGAPAPYKFFAVDLKKKEIIWETEFEDVYAGLDDVPAAIYKNKYVITTAIEDHDESDEYAPNHMIYAMDIKTGEVVWEDNLGTGGMVANNKSGAPIVYKNQIFVGSPITKTFYSYDAKNGEQLWNFPTNVNKAPPVASKNVVYFTDVKGFVYAFNTESGELLGKKELGGKLAPAGPVLMNDHLIVGSQDSNVYILPTKEITKPDESEAAAAGKSDPSYSVPTKSLISIALAILLGLFIVIRKKLASVSTV